MTDLSEVQNRVQTRDRLGERRSSILPQRRNQQPVRTETAARMRDARIGDVGGAEALLRISRQVNRSLSEFQDYQNQQFLQNESELSQQGSVDAATGNVDEELAAKNESYNRAVRLGQVRNTLAGILPTVQSNITTEIAGQTGMSIEERRAGIDAAIDETFAGTLTDEAGNIVNFGTAEATVYAANKLQAVRAQVQEQAYAQAQANMDQESIDAAANYVAEAMLDGETINVEDVSAHLTPTADREKLKQAVFLNIERMGKASPEEAVPAIEKLIEDIGNGQGASFFDASDTVNLRLALDNASEERDRERDRVRNRRYDENAEELFDLYNTGGLTRSEIMSRREDDDISGRFARTLINALESDERQAAADARARRSEARQARSLALQEARATMEGQLGYQILAAKSGVGITNTEQVLETADFFASRGAPLGIGQLSSLYTASQQGAAVVRERPEFKLYAQRLTDAVTGAGSPLNDGDLTADQTFLISKQLEDFEALVQEGKTPREAYSTVSSTTYEVPTSFVGFGADEEARLRELANK